MAQGILSLQNKPITSDNLLNKEFLFTDSFSWNTVSGGSNATATNVVEQGKQCCKINFTGTSPFVFNRSGTDMDCTVPVDGDYILQWWLFKNNPLSVIDFTLEVFINGSVYADTTFEVSIDATNGDFVYKNFNCYYNQVILTLDAGDEVTFQYTAQGDTTGSGEDLFLADMKLELNNVNQGYVPSVYSQPLDIVIEQTETINFDEILTLEYETITFTMTGAKVGDTITCVAPLSFLEDSLVISSVWVSDDDEVKVMAFNPTDSGVDTASGDFKFKIVR